MRVSMKSLRMIPPCYECSGYGYDYSYDDDGELVSNCDDCLLNPYNE